MIPQKLHAIPITPGVDKDQLATMLSQPDSKRIFCWHQWTVYTVGGVERLHRVCSKCYKKQVNSLLINRFSPRWIKDDLHYY